MVILEKPYVSDFLQQTVVNLQIPVLKTDFVETLSFSKNMKLLEPNDFFSEIKNNPEILLYSNSENSGQWLNSYIPDNEITKLVNKLKDKSVLRDLFSKIYTDFWYKTFSLNEILNLEYTNLPKQFVVKPKRGFASICIHSVFSENDWEKAKSSIKKEVVEMQNVFPDLVVSLQEFIIESFIEGKELAIDAYFDTNGNPVILNVLTHLHSSKYDMSDRLYVTSDEIFNDYYEPILKYLEQMNELLKIKNFPFHLEMIADNQNRIIPVEINPMRFMGFCVADVDFLFYGVNPYEFYFKNLKPNWSEILKSRENKIFALMVIDIPKHLDREKIKFNYDKFIKYYTKPLHYIQMDYTVFPMSIIMFAEVEKTNFSEFEYILNSDIMEFIE